jgi:type IV secretory pathway VirB3-like protein
MFWSMAVKERHSFVTKVRSLRRFSSLSLDKYENTGNCRITAFYKDSSLQMITAEDPSREVTR